MESPHQDFNRSCLQRAVLILLSTWVAYQLKLLQNISSNLKENSLQ